MSKEANAGIMLPSAVYDKYHSWIVLSRTKSGILSCVSGAPPRLLHTNYVIVPEIAQDNFASPALQQVKHIIGSKKSKATPVTGRGGP
jgi:hypothetical protein